MGRLIEYLNNTTREVFKGHCYKNWGIYFLPAFFSFVSICWFNCFFIFSPQCVKETSGRQRRKQKAEEWTRWATRDQRRLALKPFDNRKVVISQMAFDWSVTGCFGVGQHFHPPILQKKKEKSLVTYLMSYNVSLKQSRNWGSVWTMCKHILPL